MDLFRLAAQNFDGTKELATIVSGPVIVNEKNKVLLHIAPSTGKWQFTGGRQTDNESPLEIALRKPKEDLQIDCLIDESTEPFVVEGMIERDGEQEHLTLIHFKARLKKDITVSKDLKWFSLEELQIMNDRGELSSANVLLASRHYLK